MKRAIKYDINREPIKNTKTRIVRTNKSKDFAIVKKTVHVESEYVERQSARGYKPMATYEEIEIIVNGILGLNRAGIISKAHRIFRDDTLKLGA